MVRLVVQAETEADGRLILRLRGLLDASTCPQLVRALKAAVAQKTKSEVILDLSDLQYITSAGLRAIFLARAALKARSGRLLILNPAPHIKQVFDLVRTVSLSERFGSSAEADVYLDLMQRAHRNA